MIQETKKDVAKKVAQNADKFYEFMQKKGNEGNSDYSWEYCYQRFQKTLSQESQYDDDELALNLAFYLASWGMYRGSSFLTKKDYKIHIPAVQIIKEYKDLFGLECDSFQNQKIQDKLNDLIDGLKDHYKNVREDVYSLEGKKEPKSDISDTLISKILIGTLGCVPAYDKYFIYAIKKEADFKGTLSAKKELFDFYNDNKEIFEAVRKNFRIKGSNIIYLQMKIVDMGFWEIGYNELKHTNNN